MAVYTGECVNEIYTEKTGTWRFDSSTGVFTISGTGRVTAFLKYVDGRPRTYSFLTDLPALYGFPENSITTLVVNSGITALMYICHGLTSLVSVSLPNTLTEIGDSTFDRCTNLATLNLPESLTTIGNMSFEKCTKLSSFVMPSSVTNIGGSAFNGCTGITTIIFESTAAPNLDVWGFSLGSASEPVTATIHTKGGWGSDSIFTSGMYGVRGSYTTFIYEELRGVTPVNVDGTWKESIPYVKVDKHWKGVEEIYVNVKGVWKPVFGEVEPTLSFNGNGGTGTMDTYTGSMTMPLPDCGFSRYGYSFIGWNTSPDGTGVSYTVGQQYTLSGVSVLFAQWVVNQYTITFNTVGGTPISPITQDYGSVITAPAEPTKDGHIFIGWDMEIPDTMPGHDLTITAVWEALYATVTYYKIYNHDYPLIYPPSSNSGPVSKNGDNYYLNCTINGVELAGLGDNFTVDDKYSPTRSITVDKGSELYVQLINKYDGQLCKVYLNGTLVSGPSEYNYYTLPGGIRTNMTITFTWESEGTILSNPQSYWDCRITTE